MNQSKKKHPTIYRSINPLPASGFAFRDFGLASIRTLGLKEALERHSIGKDFDKNMMLSLFPPPCSTLAVVSKNFEGPSSFRSSASALPCFPPGSRHREVRFGRSTHVQLLLPSDNFRRVLRTSFPKCSKMWLVTSIVYHVHWYANSRYSDCDVWQVLMKMLCQWMQLQDVRQWPNGVVLYEVLHCQPQGLQKSTDIICCPTTDLYTNGQMDAVFVITPSCWCFKIQ